MRKEKTVTVEMSGRDFGKVFHLTEMSAFQAEAWGIRALLALARSGVEMPDNFTSLGLAGMAIVGVKALGGLEYAAAQPLLAEMLAQVQIVPDPNRGMVRRPLGEDDVEEVATLLWLRQEIVNLHVDFFTNGALRKQAQAAVIPPQS